MYNHPGNYSGSIFRVAAQFALPGTHGETRSDWAARGCEAVNKSLTSSIEVVRMLSDRAFGPPSFLNLPH